jgi:hypothetical protein
LYRDDIVVVVTFEKVIDVIREAHTKWSHAMEPEKTNVSSMMTLDIMEFPSPQSNSS